MNDDATCTYGNCTARWSTRDARWYWPGGGLARSDYSGKLGDHTHQRKGAAIRNMQADQLKELWAILGGSANQNISNSVFAVAAEFGENQGWDVLIDKVMDAGDLYYQEWNAQMCAVITVLNAIATGHLNMPLEVVESDESITVRWTGSGMDAQALRDNGIRD